MIDCECKNWCRMSIDLNYLTDHHPNCEHYNDSLIDVWMVAYNGQYYYDDKEPDGLGNGEIVTKQKMHREVFEHLEEFDGF